MSSETQYFNFPVQLLNNYLTDKEKCLDRILYYSLFYHAENRLEYGVLRERIQASAKYYGVKLGSIKTAIAEGRELNDSLNDQGSPIVGVSTKLYWDYRSNRKTEFEEITFLAYLAIKSIVQKKAYCKITNLYWLSRMDGKSHSVSAEWELSEEVRKFSKAYQINKIKEELSINWNLIHYGRYTRGFYVSFKMSLEDLIFQVEKKRKSRQLQVEKEKRKLALNKAMERVKYQLSD